MKKITKILICSLFLLLSGCAYKAFKPVPGEYHIEENYAIIRTDSLLIAIRPQAYRNYPDDVAQNFLSVYVQVKNLTKERMLVPRGSFGIVSKGKQYDPIPVEYILSDFQRRLYLKQFDMLPNEESGSFGSKNDDLDRYYELMGLAFSFGEVLPAATKEGYLFYHGSLNKTDAFSIDALGHEVNFSK